MYEDSTNQAHENQTKRKMENQQDIQVVQAEMQEMLEQVIDDAPKLSLNVKNAPFCLNMLFDQEGNPKGNFRVTDRYKKRVYFAFKHPSHKSTTGEIYWGKLSEGVTGYSSGPIEYLIQATPTFLNDEELEELEHRHRLTKEINGVEVELVPPMLQRDNYSSRVERYRETIGDSRKKVQEITNIISELETLKPKLPMGTREVIIEQNDSFENPSGYPHK